MKFQVLTSIQLWDKFVDELLQSWVRSRKKMLGLAKNSDKNITLPRARKLRMTKKFNWQRILFTHPKQMNKTMMLFKTRTFFRIYSCCTKLFPHKSATRLFLQLFSISRNVRLSLCEYTIYSNVKNEKVGNSLKIVANTHLIFANGFVL